MDLAPAVRELYALGQAEFVAARDRLARTAKAGGDAGLAAAIKKLRKPSAGAWLANMLALHRQADLLPVLELGAELRAAQDQLDGDELRRLGRERAGVVRSALGTARDLADQLGQQVGGAAIADLEQTLRAALNDTEAAAAVASGQLVRALSATGMGPVDLDDALADPASVPPVPTLPNHRLRPVITRPEPTAEPRHQEHDPVEQARKREAERKAREAAERQERRRAEAEELVARTRVAAESLDAELAEARAAVTTTAAEYERLTTKLAQLREHVVALDREAKEARSRHREAQKALRTTTLPR